MKLILRLMPDLNDTENNILKDSFLFNNIDIAGAIVAKELVKNKVATVCVDECNFFSDIKYENAIEFYAKILKIGNTSVKTQVDVYSNKILNASAIVTYVCIDDFGKSLVIPKNLRII